MSHVTLFLPASAVAGQQVFEVVLLPLVVLIKLQKQEKHCINPPYQGLTYCVYQLLVRYDILAASDCLCSASTASAT